MIETQVGGPLEGVAEVDHDVPTGDDSSIVVRSYTPGQVSPKGSPLIVMYHGGFCNRTSSNTYSSVSDFGNEARGCSAERALREEYGVKAKIDIYPGLPHIFWNYFADLSVTKRHDQDTIAGFKWLLREES